MTPARSLAASVVALGFASALTAPQPALAAPAPCERAENFAAQSGAELLRINKLEIRSSAERPKVRDGRDREKAGTEGTAGGAAGRVLSGHDDSVVPDPEDSDTVSESIGMIGTGVLGYLGAAPKAATGTDGVADVVPPARRGPVDKIAEQGGDVVDGLTGGVGGGEPTGDEADNSGNGHTGPAGSKTGGASGNGARGVGATGNSATGDGASTDGAKAGGADARGAEAGDPGDGDRRADRVNGTGAEDDGDGRVSDKRARPTSDGNKTIAAVSEIGLGEARTAMIAKARISAAAYARLLDGSGHPAVAKPLLQQAPPTNAKAAQRSTPAGRTGPLTLGKGRIGTHAQWDPGMACGRVAGETGRSDVSLSSLSLLKGDLVRVPGTMTSRGTTAIEHHNDEARTAARSTVTAGLIELAGGKVRVRVLRAPTLEAAMSATSGGKVSYRPAVVEVSGEGIATKRLSAAGEHVDIALTPDRHTMESASLKGLTGLGRTAPMPVPTIPGLPPVSAPQPESATAPEKGIKLRVSLGDVRHAIKGHAIAARAASIKVAMTQSSGSKGRGQDGYGSGSDLTLTMSMGLLEAAAVSPEAPAVSPAGQGGGLPVTGPRLDRIAMAGGALLLAGVGAVLIGLRRRRTQA
ncbi:hypothetical protein JIG36_20950 [Actinoplanes sp. LDG1-06]|uniref:Gram-positive cocci surface proteins LPxTG domain-containing protein n=1 Tax=Paractinoplanes ovalisporus TaxID=2810368 RepID=A0ABS2ADW8_9ACTN|nr:hypothetical protein [Actinoplanes ovalisporus]MBM2618028.1 hypothetical protein [Actinoplanes ovalisporus]